MSLIAPALAQFSDQILALTTHLGKGVDVAALGATCRQNYLSLGEPGLHSPNGTCRLVRAADGWIAVNLSRDEDRDLVPAWLECGFGPDPWTTVEDQVGFAPSRTLLARAKLLGLPVAQVGEVRAGGLDVPLRPFSSTPPLISAAPLKVVDLSALWAGPLCGAVLAAMGAYVLRLQCVRRPDPTREHTPEFHHQLNGDKDERRLDFADSVDRARLSDEIATAQVLITNMRPRGLASMGLSARQIMDRNPRLIWVAITGYGWEAGDRVAFGDDAAAAGGLLNWEGDEPRFAGDALADPLAGLAAALGVLRVLGAKKGGVLVDAALARCAAGAMKLSQATA